jgi:serine/threonine protein kinase
MTLCGLLRFDFFVTSVTNVHVYPRLCTSQSPSIRGATRQPAAHTRTYILVHSTSKTSPLSVSASLVDRRIGRRSQRYALRALVMACFDARQQLAAETVVWRRLTHPNLVPFLGIVQDQNVPFAILHTVTPWMPQGTLLNFIKSSHYDACCQRLQLVCEGSASEGLIRSCLSF